jgi:metal-responsive CopG/Arc/MetJ family transcriptional regulator
MARSQRRPLEAPGKQQFNVYLPRDLVKELKHHAIERGDSLSRLVEKIFRDYLKQNEEVSR